MSDVAKCFWDRLTPGGSTGCRHLVIVNARLRSSDSEHLLHVLVLNLFEQRYMFAWDCLPPFVHSAGKCSP